MIHLELSDAINEVAATGAAAAGGTVLVGPVVCRDGGFAFDVWTATDGVKRGFAYRQVEQAEYDRRTTLLGLHQPAGTAMTACATAAAFADACDKLAATGAPFAWRSRAAA